MLRPGVSLEREVHGGLATSEAGFRYNGLAAMRRPYHRHDTDRDGLGQLRLITTYLRRLLHEPAE